MRLLKTLMPLGLVGAALVLASCSSTGRTPDSSVKKTTERRPASTTAKVGIVGSTIVVLAFETIECRDVVGSPAPKPVTPWKKCAPVRPAVNRTVTLRFRDTTTTLSDKTNEDGIAEFDLTNLQPTVGILLLPSVTVHVHGNKVATQDIRTLEIYSEWQKRGFGEQAAAKEAKDRAEAKPNEKAEKEALQKAFERTLARLNESKTAADCRKNMNFLWLEKCLTKVCKEQKQQEACTAVNEIVKKDVAGLEGHLANEARAFRESERRKAASKRASRSMQNPADVHALGVAIEEYAQCVFECVSKVKRCINSAPSGRDKNEYIKETCNPPYQQCQRTCRSSAEAEGFCFRGSRVRMCR